MTVYVLTDGEYSDYHIIGVYSSEESGSRAAAKFGGSLESYEVDEYVKDDRYLYCIVNDTRNDETRVHIEYALNSNVLNSVRHYNYPGHPESIYTIYVMAEDKEHAVKIAADLVAQYKALPIQKS